ncbi:unnamed protein product [Penicillium olsonii]|uniref:NmrA-like domain-containing protein n=1 Tax=Penicillium olsonii TaxID=99116 RepID=A0A9W4MMC0_PENOL|nr:unnamed protein product [Penicillium olsonii]CAG8065258.1 unnamed protein product [Penicillium olsonii]
MSQEVALVTGATGQQGGATARELLKAGLKVHALVRNPLSDSAVELQRLGVQLFPGDFDDKASLNAAMKDVTAIFLNVSPILSDHEREVIQAKNILQAASSSGTVTTIVYSSVTMTGKHESFPNWSPRDAKYWTILRPAFLMNNYHGQTASHMFPDLVQKRTFLKAYKPSTAMTLVDPGDVGKFAAAAIVDPEAFNRHEIDLGVESLTPAEIVKELSRASGTDIALQFYSEREAADLALKDPRIDAQLWANDVGYQVDFERLSKYPLRLTPFSEYLEEQDLRTM